MRPINVIHITDADEIVTGTYYPAADGDMSRLETDATDPDDVQGLWDAVADTLDDHDTRPLRPEEN